MTSQRDQLAAMIELIARAQTKHTTALDQADALLAGGVRVLDADTLEAAILNHTHPSGGPFTMRGNHLAYLWRDGCAELILAELDIDD